MKCSLLRGALVLFLVAYFAVVSAGSARNVDSYPEITYFPHTDLIGVGDVNAGETLKIPCKARGTKPLTHTWKINGTKIDFNSSSSSCSLDADGGLVCKNIKSNSDHDQQTYQCFVSNRYGTVFSRVLKVDVTDIIIPISGALGGNRMPYLYTIHSLLIVYPTYHKVHLGANYTWGVYNWTDRKLWPLPNSRSHCVTSDGRLIFSAVKKSDLPELLYLKLSVGSTSYISNPYEFKSSSTVAPSSSPSVVEGPSDLEEVWRGSTKIMRCIPSGYPIPGIKWWKDGQFIVSGRYNMELQSFDRILVIKNANEKLHSGTYQCGTAHKNESLHQQLAKTKLVVKGPPIFTKRPPKALTAFKGTSFLLECTARVPLYPTNETLHYYWFKNGEKVQFNWGKIVICGHIGLGSNLIVPTLEIDDSGVYQCVIMSLKGQTTAATKVHVKAETFTFTAWGGWTKCLSTSGSNIRHRYRFRTCVTSSKKELAPGRCSGKTKQAQNCDVEVSTQSPPVRTPTPTETASVRPVMRKVVAPSNSKNNSKFLDTFYGKLALGSSLAILVMILGCAVFVLVGRRIEKKDKNKRRGRRPMKDLEDTPFNDGPSNVEYSDDYEDEMDRKAFEKRRVIKELTPKERKRSELDDDLIVARTIILEEGINKDLEREVAEKRKKVVKSTSSAGCKKSLLESINSSRAIILDKDTTNVDNVERASVSFIPRKEHKPRISSGGSRRGSSYHSLDETKNTQNGNDEDSFSVMMVQPVQPLSFEARQATIKHTQDFDLKH